MHMFADLAVLVQSVYMYNSRFESEMPVNQSLVGVIFGLTAYAIWGFFPLFFYQLRDVMPTEVLAQRVIWSFIFVLLILVALKRLPKLRQAVFTQGIVKSLCVSSILISLNWLVFIWAVSKGRVLESSLGYFITPLVSVFLAKIILKEKTDKWRMTAILFALAGILWIVFKMGYMPWVSLILAISFGLYGLVRKQVKVDALTGLTIETFVLIPFALGYWYWLDFQGSSLMFHGSTKLTLLLMVSGIVTAMPLLFFASAAKKLSLTVLGFLMYINPSMQFITAVFVLGEPLNSDLLVSFYFIWIALFIFSAGSLKQSRVSD